MAKTLKVETKDIVQSFKITETESKKLKAKAKKHGVTTSAYIRYILEQDLDK